MEKKQTTIIYSPSIYKGHETEIAEFWEKELGQRVALTWTGDHLIIPIEVLPRPIK